MPSSTPSPALEAAFALGDLIGEELLAQYGGDGLSDLLDQVLVVSVSQTGSGLSAVYSATVAIASDGTGLLPIIGDSLQLDPMTPGAPPLPQGTTAPDGMIPIGTVSVSISPFSLSLTVAGGLVFSTDILTPIDGSDPVTIPLQLSLTINSSGVTIADPQVVLPPCMLGSTGIQLNGGTIIFALWGNGGNPQLQQLGIDSSFRGVAFQQLSFTLPSELAGDAVTGLSFPFAAITPTGFSGKLQVSFGPGADLSFLGATLAPTQLAISIENNALNGAQVSGTLQLPFFDQPVGITLGLGDGGWTLGLTTPSCTLEVDGVLSATLTGFGVEQRDGDTWFKISGTLVPECGLGDAISASDWPTLDFKDLLINSKGQIKAAGGKMGLASHKTLQIGSAFKATLTDFGFGTDDSGNMFVSLSGEVDLVAGLSLAGVFDDLRISWNSSGLQGVTLKGIEISAEEDGVFDIDGALDFSVSGVLPPNNSGLSAHGFIGSITFGLDSLGLEIDAQLAVIDVTPASGSSYTALFVALDVGLPAGIPLFDTGLAIYGLNGLLALHFTPSADALFAGNWFQWFLGPPIGATSLGGDPSNPNNKPKWIVQEDGYGFGAGIAIGTLPDVAFTLNVKTTLVVALPGPDIILSGACDLLDLPTPLTSDGATPQFQIMVVYDGNAATLNAMIVMNLGQKPLLAASGQATAFYDFNDSSKWYVDLGTQATPIQGTALSIFQASAYLDIDATEIQMGAQAGFDEKWSFGPLSVHAVAMIGGNATLTYRPLRLDGTAYLNGQLALSAFGVNADVSLAASVSLSLLSPASPLTPTWDIAADIHAELKVNLFLVHADKKASIHIEIKSGDPTRPDPPTVPLAAMSIEHAHSSERWTLSVTDTPSPGGSYDGGPASPPPNQSSVVPPDGLPTFTFAVSLSDQTGIAQTRPSSTGAATVGNQQYQYALTSVAIQQMQPDGMWAPFPAPLTGQWSAVTGGNRLQLFADTPYFLSMSTQTTNRGPDQQVLTGPSPCATIIYVPVQVCAHVQDAPRLELSADTWMLAPRTSFEGITLESPKWLPVGPSGDQLSCLLETGCRVVFDDPVNSCVITVTRAVTSLPTTVFALGDNGARMGATLHLSGPTGAAGWYQVTVRALSSRPFQAVLFNLPLPPTGKAVAGPKVTELGLVSVCYITLAEEEKAAASLAAAEQNSAALTNPANTNPAVRPVFLPNTTYQVTTVTTATRQGDNATTSFTDTAQFQTGPAPVGFPLPGSTQTLPAAPQADVPGYPYGGSLADLGAYIAATMPAAAPLPAKSAKGAAAVPARFESGYCGYDPAVIFNEGYVETLYSENGTPLSLDVVEMNAVSAAAGASAAEAQAFRHPRRPVGLGTIGRGGLTTHPAGSNYSFEAPAHASRFRTLWQTQLRTAPCDIQQQFPPDQGMGLALGTRYALLPAARYQTRLLGGGMLLGSAIFLTSRYLTASHQLNSHPGFVFTIAVPAAASLDFSQAASMGSPSAVGEAEDAAFSALVAAAGAAPYTPRETIDASALTTSSGVAGLLVTSPEPLPWDRISWTADAAPASSLPAWTPVAPTLAKITDWNLSTGYVDLIVLKTLDPSGWILSAGGQTIYKFANEGAWPCGTQFRVFMGPLGGAPVADIQTRTGSPLPSSAQTVELLSGIATLQSSPLVPENSYQGLTATALRKLDGTAFVISPSGTASFAPGDLRLTISILRDVGDVSRVWTRASDTSPEAVRLHVMIPSAQP